MNVALFSDFDHTLFDTDLFFHVDVRNRFLKLGIEPTYWEEAYDNIISQGYTLQKHIEEVLSLSGSILPLIEMQKILSESFSDLSRYLFPDVREFLEDARHARISLYLLSFGSPDWQQYKVMGSGIDQLFTDIFFTSSEGKKHEVIARHAESFDSLIMVENDPRELDAMRDAIPATQTFYVNRVASELVVPKSEEERMRFLDARKYLDKPRRHRHVECHSLNEVRNHISL